MEQLIFILNAGGATSKLLSEISNQMFSEVDYHEVESMDMVTAESEEYKCVLPQIKTSNEEEASEVAMLG